MTMKSINPANGQTVETYAETPFDEVENAVEAAGAFFKIWKKKSFAERAVPMVKAASILRENRDAYARLMAVEMGKPVRDGRAEAEKCAWVCEYFAEHGEKMLENQEVRTDAPRSFITFQPLGPILAVMPWNYPFWQVFRFAAPALTAGDTVLLKHASNVSGCALAIEELFHNAGFPEETFKTLLIRSTAVEKVIEHPAIRAVTLTGSTSAGRAVGAAAGRMLKKTVLELGGSDPYIVLEDADLPDAVRKCVAGRLLNSGQSCIAAKRFIVVEPVRKRFEELMVSEMRSKTMGDPLREDVQIGPQARKDLREDLHRQVTESVRKGAELLLGGEIPDGPGFYYPPTVLSGVRPGMPAFDEETFGPVAAVISAADENEAIELANRSDFGLGGAVFSKNVEKALRIAAYEIETGNCFVNDFVKSDPRLPFGGIKDSGHGRELSSFGIREFVNIKTVSCGK